MTAAPPRSGTGAEQQHIMPGRVCWDGGPPLISPLHEMHCKLQFSRGFQRELYEKRLLTSMPSQV